jgi:hypothetical protein
MGGRGSKVQRRASVTPEVEAYDLRLRQRRWRILRTALPRGHEVGTLPLWIATPGQFLGWIAPQLPAAAAAIYFADLERIARQTADLELFRLSRQYRGRP